MIWQVVHVTNPIVTGGNEHGQEVYGDPINTVRDVYGWSPKKSIGRGLQSQMVQQAPMQNRTVTEIFLLTPDRDWGYADNVLVPTDPSLGVDGPTVMYWVNGQPENYNFGPFGFQPGYRVSLFTVSDGTNVGS